MSARAFRMVTRSDIIAASIEVSEALEAVYGVLVLGMKNTLLHQVKSGHQTGGTPTPNSIVANASIPPLAADHQPQSVG